MSLPALLDELDQRGITVEPRPDGNLSVRPWTAVPLELRERLRAEKPVLTAYLRARELARQAEREGLDLVQYTSALAPDFLGPDSTSRISPAESIISTCKRLDIALWLGADGCLVVGREESAIPRSLVMAVEAHVNEIARLLQADARHQDAQTLLRLTRPVAAKERQQT
jgi:hypothetical protein